MSLPKRMTEMVEKDLQAKDGSGTCSTAEHNNDTAKVLDAIATLQGTLSKNRGGENRYLLIAPGSIHSEGAGHGGGDPHKCVGRYTAPPESYHGGLAAANTPATCTPGRHRESAETLQPHVHWHT